MAVTTTMILDRVEKTLLDESNVTWTRTELLDYLNAVLRFICSVKPDAYILCAAQQLTTNETKQTVPTGGYQVLRLIRNMGANGTTVGDAITKVEANHLDRVDPTWHTVAGAAVKHWTHDPRNPAQYWVYPKVSTTWNVEVEYAAVPTTDRDEAGNNDIIIRDIYETALYWGILAMAYAKNAKRGDDAKFQAYFNLLVNATGSKDKAQAMFTAIPVESDTGA